MRREKRERQTHTERERESERERQSHCPKAHPKSRKGQGGRVPSVGSFACASFALLLSRGNQSLR